MERRGEVRIEREWRQRCSRDLHHGEADLGYPDLVEDGGAAWVMEKLRNRIRKVFYYNRDDQMPGYFPGYHPPLDESKDHHSADCEADLSAMFDIASKYLH